MTPQDHARVWNNVMLAMENMAKRAERDAGASVETQGMILLFGAFAGEIARAYSQS
jgi:hypothetical protein